MNRRTILLLGIISQILVLLFSFLFFTRHINKNDEAVINYYNTLPVIQEKDPGQNIPAYTEKQIASRNPFHPERGLKQEKQKQVKSIKDASHRTEFILSGIFSYGQSAGALISYTSATGKGQIKRVYKVGEPIKDGYHLKELKKDKVILIRGNQTLELTFKKRANSKAFSKGQIQTLKTESSKK